MYRYVSHRVLLQFGLFTIALRAEMVSYRYSTVYSTGYRVSRPRPRGAVDSGLAAVLAAVESVAVRVCRWI